MRLMATMLRKGRTAERLRQMRAAAAARRGSNQDNGATMLVLPLPVSSMLRQHDNGNLSLKDEDRAG